MPSETINKSDVLTVGVFERLLDEILDRKLEEKLESKFEEKLAPIHARIDRLETKMMDGFEAVFANFERLERHIDDLSIRKADREDVLALHRRILKLETAA